jgi:hypothetical protein
MQKKFDRLKTLILLTKINTSTDLDEIQQAEKEHEGITYQSQQSVIQFRPSSKHLAS